MTSKRRGSHDGYDRYEWDFTWTADQSSWHTVLFETLDECREFAQEKLSENEENPKYMYFARRYCTVSSCDLLDNTIQPVHVRLAGNYAVA